jgi:branched-chain amino acid transport system ATP-binding protein
VLDVINLHVGYGKVSAVAGIDVSVEPGKITLILGANGAGKTTTLRTICGLLRPTQGDIVLYGDSLVGLRPHQIVKRGVVMVPEGRKVFAQLTVAENLRLGGYTLPDALMRSGIARAYELFPILYERKDSPAGLLSGGEQQMLAFSRALMSQPKFMLMDEPSMGLAPAVIETVMEKAREIAASGIGVLMVEQNAEAGLAVADEVVLVTRGELIFKGSASAARSNQSVVLAFLGEAALDPDAPGEVSAADSMKAGL